MFEMFDADRSGQIDAEELFELLKMMNIEDTKEGSALVLKEIDVDNSGCIDFDEYAPPPRALSRLGHAGCTRAALPSSHHPLLFFTNPTPHSWLPSLLAASLGLALAISGSSSGTC